MSSVTELFGSTIWSRSAEVGYVEVFVYCGNFIIGNTIVSEVFELGVRNISRESWSRGRLGLVVCGFHSRVIDVGVYG